MKPEELRIGNLIIGVHDNGYFEEEHLCRVVGLDSSGFSEHKIWVETIGDSGVEYYDEFKPIPLTPEWLKRAGFMHVKNETYIGGDQWLLQVSNDHLEYKQIINEDGTWFDGIGKYGYKESSMVSVNTLCRGNYVCNSISTVHQLQSLYYDLTGNELEIKPFS